MVSVPVNPNVLVWARKVRGLSQEKAAAKLRITVAQLEELEGGEKVPSLGMLDRIAGKYQIPLASLMMPEPLPDTQRPRIPDFRTIAGETPTADTQLLVAIDAVDQQVETLADLKTGHSDLFSGTTLPVYSISDGPRKVAEAERGRIGPELAQQFKWPSAAQAFRHFRAIVEGTGVFVYLADLGPLSNVRGFSIFDERDVPVAVINNDEGETAARTFSLFHEFAHILIRQTGISDQNARNGVERWCNQFAAYYLMPADEFAAIARELDPAGVWADSKIRKLADLFKVSMRAVALHLEDLGFAPTGFYEAKSKVWSAGKKAKPGGQPMPYAEQQVHRLGVRLVSVVLDALDRGYVNQLDAYELTDVAPKHFKDLRKEMASRQEQYGRVR